MKINFSKNIIFVSLALMSILVAVSCVAAEDIGDSVDASTIVNGNFVMSVPYNAGTGYHWEVSSDSYGVEVASINYVQDHPGTVGSSGTGYFAFNIIDADNYYAKLVLISPSGEIVKEVDSGMLN